MSFMIDSDTDVSTKECVIVYSRILRKGRPVNILIGHTEVEHAHTQGKFEGTDIQCLAKVFGPLERFDLLPHIRPQT